MKKVFYIVLIFFVVSFKPTETNNCIQILFNRIDPVDKNKYKKTITENKSVISHSIDSSSYKILRRWTSSGVPILESIINDSTAIMFRKEFYNNGILKSVGYKTINSQPIGIWKYYSPNKHLDSTINYDKIYLVSYCEFYNMCVIKGLTKTWWNISFDNQKRKWKLLNTHFTKLIPKGKANTNARVSILTGITLQVDSMKIENFKEESIYE